MKRLLLVLLGVGLVAWPLSVGQALPRPQPADPLVVAFTTANRESDYRANSTFNFGRFTQLINTTGARVRGITLQEEIAPDVDLVIVAGPKTPAISAAQTSRLWNFIQRGGNVLILADGLPNRGLNARSSLNDLLWQDYGIRWRDDLIIEDYFSEEAIETIRGRQYLFQPVQWAAQFADPVGEHPVTAPLQRFDLPLFYWHARTLEVQQPALRGDPVVLFETQGTGYAETRITRDGVQFNLEQDRLGKFTIGAAVEDFESGARIVVLGDSEIFKYTYGLEVRRDLANAPTYTGDWLFTQAVIRWLLGLPLEEIPLSPQFVWFSIDGDPAEWVDIPAAYTSDTGDGYKIVRSDRRVYLQIPAPEVPPQGLSITSVDDRGDTWTSVVDFEPRFQTTVSNSSGVLTFPAANVATESVTEIELPLQSLPQIRYAITEICVLAPDLSCESVEIPGQPRLIGAEPAGNALIPGAPTGWIRANVINLRTEPDAGLVIDQIPYGSTVNVLGEDETGTWVEVWTGDLRGWMFADLMQFAFDR